VNSEGPVNVWTVNPPAVVFVPPSAETPRVIVGASFTGVTVSAKERVAVKPPASVTVAVIVLVPLALATGVNVIVLGP
jgi:hypothetical protein